MKISILILALTLSVFSLPNHANPKYVQQAENQAELWLASIDKGNAKSSYGAMSSLFARQLSQEQWQLSIQGMHGYFGKAGTRIKTSSIYKTESYGAPSGDYVDVVFSTDYDNAPGRKEVVTMVRDSTGTWKVAGFSIE